jgi:hypothetical protein
MRDDGVDRETITTGSIPTLASSIARAASVSDAAGSMLTTS